MVNRSALIPSVLVGLLPERERLKHDLKPSLADLRPTFLQDRNLCRSSLHVGWPGGSGRSLILKQICSGLLKAPLLKGRGSLPHFHFVLLKFGFEFFCSVFLLLGRCFRSGRENVVEPLLTFTVQMRHGHQVMKSRNFGQVDFFFYPLPVEMELCQKLIVSIICPKFFRAQS